jgi:hypothetical protein
LVAILDSPEALRWSLAYQVCTGGQHLWKEGRGGLDTGEVSRWVNNKSLDSPTRSLGGYMAHQHCPTQNWNGETITLTSIGHLDIGYLQMRQLPAIKASLKGVDSLKMYADN